jgi:hypothetical protein
MIDPEVIEAFNTRQTVDLNNIKTMKPAQLDRVKSVGSSAENLLTNKDLAMFIHQYKFELCDLAASITGHKEEDNALRISVANQIAGIDGFITTLKRAVYFKNRVVTMQSTQVDSGPNS